MLVFDSNELYEKLLTCKLLENSPTQRLLSALGYEFKGYDELQACFEVDNALMAANFHGMIVEYVKNNSKKKSVDIGRF